MPSSGTIAVIILTYNEDANIAKALSNVVGWANQVFVLDSMSTDDTLAIAKQHECHVAQHPFEGYAKQRNYALDNLPIRSEWVFFLDADEVFSPALKNEISSLITTVPAENGFYVRFQFMWMGRWIRRGYYPSWILRMCRHGKARCENRAIHERLLVEGATGYLSNDLIHEDRRGIGNWINRHNRYASLEALELARTEHEHRSDELDPRLMGSQAERKRWIRRHVWNRLPPLLRPLVYFFYRYVLRLGFLEGVPGFTYNFLQALWYPMLIDINYLEQRRRVRAAPLTRVTPLVDVSLLADSARHEQTR